MQLKLTHFFLPVLMIFSLMASAADEGETLYQAKGCATCHGPAGISPAPIWPNIAGQHKQYLVTQIKDIKSGARNNAMSASMKPMVATLSDEEIDKISDWLSKLK